MRTWIFFLIIMASAFAFGASSDHLSKLKSKFPYGLIGDDYGVLTLDDLALNACHISPEPFVSGVITPYEYWQCFESKTILAECGNIGVLEGEGIFGRVTITAYSDQTVHKFIESRPWPLQECQSFVKDLKRLIKQTSHACVSASYVENNTDKSGQKVSIGIFHRLKTQKGYEGELGELTEKVRRDFCPDRHL